MATSNLTDTTQSSQCDCSRLVPAGLANWRGVLPLAFVCLVAIYSFGEPSDHLQGLGKQDVKSQAHNRGLPPVRLRQEDVDTAIRNGVIRFDQLRRAQQEGRVVIEHKPVGEMLKSGESERASSATLMWVIIWGIGGLAALGFLLKKHLASSAAERIAEHFST